MARQLGNHPRAARTLALRRRVFMLWSCLAFAGAMLLGAWNLAAPGAVLAVDPSPSPVESVPPVSPAPVPGVTCTLYSLLGSDLPPCPSPTPRPSPYVLYQSPGPSPSEPPPGVCAFVGELSDGHYTITTGLIEGLTVDTWCVMWWAARGADSLTITGTETVTVGGAGEYRTGSVQTRPVDDDPELRSPPWVGLGVTGVSMPGSYALGGTPSVTHTVAFTAGNFGAAGLCAATSGASSVTCTWDITVAHSRLGVVEASPAPSPSGPVWPIPGVNCVTYPLAGSDLPACSSGQFWQEGVNCVLFPLVAGLPGADLPICPPHPIVPGIDCAIYPIQGGEMPPCPTAMPSPGDCVMYGLIGSDAPVCPEGFPAVPWRHEWPISGMSCPVVKWGFQAYDRTPVCAFPGLTLNLGDYMSWLGCMVGVILTTLVNAIRWGINSLIDMFSPCPPVIAATLARFGDSFQQGPFSMVAGTVHALQSGVSGGPGIPYGSFTLYGHTYHLPLMEVAHAAAPIRNYLQPIVAFGIGIRALGMFATAVKGPGPTGDEGGGKK